MSKILLLTALIVAVSVQAKHNVKVTETSEMEMRHRRFTALQFTNGDAG